MNTNITVFNNCDMDNVLMSTVKEMQIAYSCFIIVYRNNQTGEHFMNVITFDCRHWDDILVSEKDSVCKVAVGIRKWFRENGNEVKGG